MVSIPRAPFGRTGHLSTRALFGAAALAAADQSTADRTMELLMEWGVNHIDTAASYGDAELRLGPWLKHHRKEVFLATKTEERTYQGARDELHRSLDRMKVDSVDLWQMHVLIRKNEWQTAMGEGGALEAFSEAREQGLVKWLGVTGHGVGAADMHSLSLERFDFDSVLLPWNWPMSLNADYAAGFRKLHTLCREKNVAFQLIKTVCRRPWPEGAQRTRSCWYEPLENQEDIDAAVHWAMGIEGSFINTIGDVGLLPRVLDAVSRFELAPSDGELDRRARKGSWEPLFAGSRQP